jgi:hypothetical protein
MSKKLKKSNITIDSTLGGVGGGGGSNSTTAVNSTNPRTTPTLGMGILAKIQPFGYIKDGKELMDYDVLLSNNSYIGRYKLEREDANYSWVISRAVEDTIITNTSNKVIPCKRMDISELNKRKVQGANEDFVYLNAARDKKEGHYWKSRHDEYCITLVIEVNHQISTKTERIRIIGNESDGWGLKNLNI